MTFEQSSFSLVLMTYLLTEPIAWWNVAGR